MAKCGGQKNRFQYRLNPNYPQQFLYLRAIQGHSGSTINPALQDNVLLPEGFTEYIYHARNARFGQEVPLHRPHEDGRPFLDGCLQEGESLASSEVVKPVTSVFLELGSTSTAVAQFGWHALRHEHMRPLVRIAQNVSVKAPVFMLWMPAHR